jgi:hypothetical protein
LTLASDAAIRAALGDLLDAAEGQTTLEEAQQLERCLRACITIRSPAFPADLRPLMDALGDEFEHRFAAQSRSVIEEALEELLSAPRAGRCVIWIEYEFALVHDSPLVMGDVTLYDSYIFVLQARNDDGVDFLHREELRTVLDSGSIGGPTIAPRSSRMRTANRIAMRSHESTSALGRYAAPERRRTAAWI